MFHHQETDNYYYASILYRGIAEVPENVSDAGSLGGEPPVVEPVIPTLGLGVACDVQVTTLFQYHPATEQHLTFEKGDTIKVIEQQVNRILMHVMMLLTEVFAFELHTKICLLRQGDWWYGTSSIGSSGWFPKSYVKEIAATQAAAVDDLDEYYIALYPYVSSEAGDLTFNQGEVIFISKKEGDWWTGIIGDRTGIFPANYVEKCDPPDQVIMYIGFLRHGILCEA